MSGIGASLSGIGEPQRQGRREREESERHCQELGSLNVTFTHRR